jgi:glyoxylate carboligase
MVEQRRVNVELEALWTSTAFIRDLVLVSTGGSSSLVASLAMVADEVENWINTAATNGVQWGTQFALVVVLSHFPKLEPKLELLGSGRDADLSGD